MYTAGRQSAKIESCMKRFLSALHNGQGRSRQDDTFIIHESSPQIPGRKDLRLARDRGE
jgi:hypothetical protein